MKGYAGATFASLGQRNYRLFFIGQSVSQTGTWMQKMAQAWLVLQLTDSGAWLGLTIAIQQLPTMLLAPWTGLLADRYPKRRILVSTAAAGVVPAICLGALTLTGTATIGLVMGLAVFIGVVDSIEKPTVQSFPAEMVPRRTLSNAVTLTSLINDLGKAVGPAIAGVLISLVGIPYTFFINSISYAAVITALLLMQPAAFERIERVTSVRGQARAGLRAVRSDPLLLWPLFLLTTVGLLAYNFQVLLPILGRDTFGGDADSAGYLLGSFGMGAVIGGIALAGLLRPTLLRITAAAGIFAVLIAGVGISPTLTVALLVVAFLGASSVAFKALTSAWLQLTADPALRGRVVALVVFSIAGTSPIGAPLVGWIASDFGARTAFIVAGVATVIAAVITACVLRRHIGWRPRSRHSGPRVS